MVFFKVCNEELDIWGWDMVLGLFCMIIVYFEEVEEVFREFVSVIV